MSKYNIDKYIISDSQIIEVAIQIIELNNSRCVVVINEHNKVVGVISEGDVLRAILKGISIKSSVRQIMITNFMYIKEYNDDEIIKIFKKGITLIPIINSEHMLVDIVDYTDYLIDKWPS